MPKSTPSTGAAKRQEPCYYHPGVDAPRPAHSTYDTLTMNFPSMPCMYISESFVPLLCGPLSS